MPERILHVKRTGLLNLPSFRPVHGLIWVCLLYMASPWVFEKQFYFNEILSISGAALLYYFRRQAISILYGSIPAQAMLLLLLCGGIHMLVSLSWMHGWYYYLRNLVMVYSMFGFVVGWVILPHLRSFIRQWKPLLLAYILVFLALPVNKWIFERFSISLLIPALGLDMPRRWILPGLFFLNVVYAYQYNSSTTAVLSLLILLLALRLPYRWTLGILLAGVVLACAGFVYLVPYLDLKGLHFSIQDPTAVRRVMDSHPFLGLDPNNTWRLILWKQCVADIFPQNLFGVGLGTPLMMYFPVEDFSKLQDLTYVMGAHNSFVYVLARLGLPYFLILSGVVLYVFHEFLRHRSRYESVQADLVFYSFFSILVIALFNPVMESPIFAAMFWICLGMTAAVIHQRKRPTEKIPES